MKTILLVEDDNFLIDIYVKQITIAGFNVQVASDGELAISKIIELKPDLVLLDIILPKISGWEVLRRIKEELKMNDLKVIVLSALAQKEDFDKAASFNIAKYLSKTENTPSQIIEEIKKILS